MTLTHTMFLKHWFAVPVSNHPWLLPWGPLCWSVAQCLWPQSTVDQLANHCTGPKHLGFSFSTEWTKTELKNGLQIKRMQKQVQKGTKEREPPKTSKQPPNGMSATLGLSMQKGSSPFLTWILNVSSLGWGLLCHWSKTNHIQTWSKTWVAIGW